MITLTTPGYGEITDLLIAYGWIESLLRIRPSLLSKSYFHFLGQQCSLEVDLSKSEWEEIQSKGLKSATIDTLNLFQGCERQGFWVSIGEPIERLKRKDWQIPKLLNEALSRKSSKFTLYLPIAPHLGDKRPFLFKTGTGFGKQKVALKSEEFIATWVGFHYFAGFYIPRSVGIYIFICVPGSKIPLSHLVILKDLSTKIFQEYRGYQELSLSAAVLHHFSRGETIFPLMTKYPWRLFAYHISKTGQSPAIRSFSSYQLNPILEFVARVKSKTKYWWKFVDACARSKNPDSQAFLNLLAEGLLFHQVGSIYKAIRLARSLFDESEKEGKQNLTDFRYIPQQSQLIEQSIKAAFEVLT